MKFPMKITTTLLLASAALGTAAFMFACSTNSPAEEDLASLERSRNIKASAKAFEAAFTVLQHPRCVNCHPAGDRPLQGDEGSVHTMNVQRGEDGKGLTAGKCASCHQSTNLPGEHMPPGTPNWRLPSKAMPLVFEHKNAGELCRQLKDQKRNGGKTIEQVFAHLSSDPLVLWGWSPGEGRTAPRMSHAEFVRQMRTWIDKGCGCPE